MILQVAGFLTQQARQWGIDASEDKLGRQTAPPNLVSRSLAGNKTVDDAKTKTQNSTSSNTTDPYDGFDPRYFKRFDFEYSSDIGVLSLSNKIRAKHNFTLST